METMTLDRETPLASVSFVAFDLETTGLFAIACHIVEIGAVRFTLDGGELGQFEQLIDPECLIAAKVTRIHGITDTMVQGEPTIVDVLPQFIDFLGDPSTVLLAHNAMFDLSFLGLALTKQGLAFPAHAVIDTLDLAQKCVCGSPSFRLEDLAIHLGLAEFEDHRGLSDARLVAKLFQTIVTRAPQLRTIGDLLDLSYSLSFRDGGSTSVNSLSGYDELTLAIEEQRTVVMVYDGGTKGAAHRRITPRELVKSSGRSYLCAFCHKDQTEKTYRLDRIRELRIEDD